MHDDGTIHISNKLVIPIYFENPDIIIDKYNNSIDIRVYFVYLNEKIKSLLRIKRTHS